jgi:hypothetical protein
VPRYFDDSLNQRRGFAGISIKAAQGGGGDHIGHGQHVHGRRAGTLCDRRAFAFTSAPQLLSSF